MSDYFEIIYHGEQTHRAMSSESSVGFEQPPG